VSPRRTLGPRYRELGAKHREARTVQPVPSGEPLAGRARRADNHPVHGLSHGNEGPARGAWTRPDAGAAARAGFGSARHAWSLRPDRAPRPDDLADALNLE